MNLEIHACTVMYGSSGYWCNYTLVVRRNMTVGECSGIMGGYMLGNIESTAGGAWFVNRKETHWGQGGIVVERRSEGCDKSQ